MSANSIDVVIYPKDDGEEIRFEGVNYVSFINGESYGIPAIIAEDWVDRKLPVRILYVSTDNIVAMDATRSI